MTKNLVSSAALLLSSLVSFSLGAQPSPSDRATARALAQEGGEALDKKNYEIAADRFARADALVHAPTLMVELARAQVGLRKFVEAQETYLRIIRDGVAPGSPPSFARANQEAQKEIKAIAVKLGWVTISVSGATSFIVTIDGTEVPKAALDVKRAVNPGNHLLKATADGSIPSEATVSVGEGESTAVSLLLKPLPPSTANPLIDTGGSPTALASPQVTSAERSRSGPATEKTWGFVAWGVGGAGLLVGSVTGLIAISKHGELQSSCPGGKCTEDDRATLDRFRTMSTISTVSFVVGAVGAITGTTLLLLAPRGGESTARIVPYVGVASIGARMTFQ